MGATTVLIAGATGFVGRRLVPALVERGFSVRAMTRWPLDYTGEAEAVGGDVHDADSLASSLAGVRVAVYLVHSLDSRDFKRRDAAAARAFGCAAGEAGVEQIVYLGGLGRGDDTLSAHLRSRREVEALLGEGGVPVTVLRAGVIVGAGGASWEMTRQLIKNLPVIIAPRWIATKTQPIGLDDVVCYLSGVVDESAALGRVFEIGGPEVLTYLEMLHIASEVSSGRRRPVFTVPMLPLRLCSYGLPLVTGTDATTGRNLIRSMSSEVVVTENSIRDLVSVDPAPYAEAVRRALEEGPRSE